MPRFASPNEVDRGDSGAKSFIGGSISVSKQDYVRFSNRKTEKKREDVRIGRRRSGVIRKAEPIPIGSSPFIQQPLVCAVPRSLLLEQIHDLLELVFPG